MSSNAVAAIAVVLVSGFAGCAATAKSAEPAVVIAPASTSPAPIASRAAPVRTAALGLYRNRVAPGG